MDTRKHVVATVGKENLTKISGVKSRSRYKQNLTESVMQTAFDSNREMTSTIPREIENATTALHDMITVAATNRTLGTSDIDKARGEMSTIRTGLSILESNASKDIPAAEVQGIAFCLFKDRDPAYTYAVEPSASKSNRSLCMDNPLTGVSDQRTVCHTCSGDLMRCPGHNSEIKLLDELMIILPQDAPIIVDILNSVCSFCSRILCSHTILEHEGVTKLPANTKLTAIANRSKSIKYCRRKHKCTLCGCILEYKAKDTYIDSEVEELNMCKDTTLSYPPNAEKCPLAVTHSIERCFKSPEYSFTRSRDLIVIDASESKEKRKSPRENTDIFTILNNISDDDAEILGFRSKGPSPVHPRDIIWRSIPVVPQNVRIAPRVDNVERPHELTKLYDEILHNIFRYNTEHVNQDVTHEIRSQISTSLLHILDSSDRKLSQRSLRTPKGIKQLVNGKQGIALQYIFSHRSEQSGRSVCSPGYHLKFGTVGMPRILARIMTLPERATPFNISSLRIKLANGSIASVTREKQHRKIIITSKNIGMNLEIGDICERHIEDGDWVLVNRAPTLHRFNMIARQVVLTDVLTLELHMADTTGLNADFDGDELFIAVIQSIHARAEALTMMSAANCMISSHDNKPITGVIFDSLVAAYILTEKNRMLTKYVFNDCMARIDRIFDFGSLIKRASKFGIEYPSGKLLFSALLPSGFTYRNGSASATSENAAVYIVNGILINGRISKQHIGNYPGSIVHTLWRDYGKGEAVQFLSDAYLMLETFIHHEGFSVGIGDCLIHDKHMAKKIEREIDEARETIKKMKLPSSDPYEIKRYEMHVTDILLSAKESAEKYLMKSMRDDNSIKVAADSGAKGSKANALQMIAALMQQFSDGKRIEPTISGGTRCLPYFSANDTDPIARGLCTHSYTEGLTLPEYIFHSMGGREGLTDTATKTADSGYTHAKMSRFMENLTVDRFGTVRDSNDNIIQIKYGLDGFAAEYLFKEMWNGKEVRTFVSITDELNALNVEAGYLPEKHYNYISKSYSAKIASQMVYDVDDESSDSGSDSGSEFEDPDLETESETEDAEGDD